jgi:tRNA(Ile)-lysidine synthase
VFELIGKIPKTKFNLACSGGIDSMVVLNFLLKYPKNDFKLLYMNHGTKHGNEAEEFLKYISKKLSLELVVGNIQDEKTKEESPEEYWRNQRYKFFANHEEPIITAHHLNDVVETWLFSCLRGNPKLINYKRNNVIRPFLLVSKTQINEWAKRNNVEWIEDFSNSETKYDRNKIRHNLIPVAKEINQGLDTMVRNKLKCLYKENTFTDK